MRIGNNSNESFDGYTGQNSQKRRQAFRRHKSIGQKVLGTVMENLKHGRAWVNVGGLTLLAELPFATEPGQKLLLCIEQLEPEIILKCIKPLRYTEFNTQIQLYTNLRNKIESIWINCLSQHDIQSSIFPPDSKKELVIGNPFPFEIIQKGNSLVDFLHMSFYQKISAIMPQELEPAFTALTDMRKEISSILTVKNLKIWLSVPWHSFEGRQQELIIICPTGQRLEQFFISGIWPEIGEVFISGMVLDKDLAFRVNALHLPPTLNELANLLNLPGLARTIYLARSQSGQPNPAEITSITCLDIKKCPPDTVANLLLRMLSG